MPIALGHLRYLPPKPLCHVRYRTSHSVCSERVLTQAMLLPGPGFVDRDVPSTGQVSACICLYLSLYCDLGVALYGYLRVSVYGCVHLCTAPCKYKSPVQKYPATRCAGSDVGCGATSGHGGVLLREEAEVLPFPIVLRTRCAAHSTDKSYVLRTR